MYSGARYGDKSAGGTVGGCKAVVVIAGDSGV
jgi:hypothetical protein